jgi:hypothetical protein
MEFMLVLHEDLAPIAMEEQRAEAVQRPGSSSARPSNEVICAAVPMVGANGRHPVLPGRPGPGG